MSKFAAAAVLLLLSAAGTSSSPGGAPVLKPVQARPNGLRGDTVDEAHMRTLIGLALQLNPTHPFAAMIVDPATDSVLCTGINDAEVNPVFHGEIVAINNCSQLIGWNNSAWLNFTLYTTAEPCSMCQSGE